jgi:hypothetical protein
MIQLLYLVVLFLKVRNKQVTKRQKPFVCHIYVTLDMEHPVVGSFEIRGKIGVRP